MPVGVLVPKSERDIATAIDIARDLKVPVLPRGGGTSQCGQTIGAALVIDNSKHFRARARTSMSKRRTATVEPGLVLDHLNAAAEAARPVVPGRRLDQRPGDARRHGRQQLVRLALDRLRQHGAQRAGRERLAVGRHAASISARCRTLSGRAAQDRCRSCASSPQQHRDEIEARWPKVMRRVGRLQPRHLRQPERAALHRRRQRQSRAPAGRRRRHAGLHQEPDARSLSRAAAREGARRRQLPDLPRRDGRGAAHRQAGADRGRAGRPHHDRAEPRQSGVPADHRERADRQAGGDPAGRVLRRRQGRRCCRSSSRPGRADGRPRACRAAWCEMADDARAEEPVGGAQGRAQHHDEPEGRRQAGQLHRGLRRAARAPRRLHRRADRSVRAARHARHLVCACVGRHAARAARSSTCARGRRRRAKMRAIAEEAAELVRKYKGAYSGEHGDGLCRGEWIDWQFGPAHQRSFPRHQARAGPDRPVQPRQDHRSAAAWTTRRCSASRRRARRARTARSP